jgi:hypothetical protein
MSNTSESSTELSGISRLNRWMERHPRFMAGVWAFFALTSAIAAVITDEEPARAFRIVFALAWALVAVREVRRYRAQKKATD